MVQLRKTTPYDHSTLYDRTVQLELTRSCTITYFHSFGGIGSAGCAIQYFARFKTVTMIVAIAIVARALHSISASDLFVCGIAGQS